MFTEETVLVLGAGSSIHYGYPTGDELIEKIKGIIKTHKFHYHCDRNTLNQMGSGHLDATYAALLLEEMAEYKDLHESLDFFDPLSIDSFLTANSSNKDLVGAAKTLIAYEIAANEDERKLNSSYRIHPKNGMAINPPRGNWYRFLWHALITPDVAGKKISTVVDEIIKNPKLKIITFNYDISLDHYLFSRIEKATFLGDKRHELLEVIKENIIHIYGQIGGKDRDKNNYGFYCYRDKDQGYHRTRTFLQCRDQWKDSIHVMNLDREHQDVKNAVTKAKEALKEAKKIFFLGYGFNDDNNNLLDFKNSCQQTEEIFYTNLGPSQRIFKTAELLLTRQFENHQGHPLYNKKPIPSSKTVYEALEHEFNLV